MAQILTLKVEGGFVLSLRGCYIWIGFQGLSSIILQMAVQTLLILRRQSVRDLRSSLAESGAVHALYESALLRRILAFMFCAEAATTTIIFAMYLTKIRFGEQCAVLGMPMVAIGFLYVICGSSSDIWPCSDSLMINGIRCQRTSDLV
jgi:hypothetical protein